MTAHRDLQDALIAEYRQLDPGDGEELRCDRQASYFGLQAGAAAETREVLRPQNVNQEVTIALEETGGGDVAITAPDAAGTPLPVNLAGNTTITLSGAGAFVTLVGIAIGGVDTILWRIAHSDGATLS